MIDKEQRKKLLIEMMQEDEKNGMYEQSESPLIGEQKRDYTKFFTPSHIAKYMVGLLGPKSGDVILEPSAGQGAIVRAIKQFHAGCVVFAFDINEVFKPYLRNAGADVVVIKDFLGIPVHAKFTGCVANPPFGNGIDLMAHFNRVCEHVKEGGKIVMIVPEDFDPPISYAAHPLENWSKNSDGSTTPIKIIEFVNKSVLIGERSAEEILTNHLGDLLDPIPIGTLYGINNAMEEYASQSKVKDGYYSHQLDRIHELTHKVAALEKENARLTEVEECNKCTILNQRQTIAELKSEAKEDSLPNQ